MHPYRDNVAEKIFKITLTLKNNFQEYLLQAPKINHHQDDDLIKQAFKTWNVLAKLEEAVMLFR